MTEYQVKALFLFNFVKYVDWPPGAFPETNTPITIGVLGRIKFGDNLIHAVEGKTVKRPNSSSSSSGFSPAKDLGGCQIFFISDSEKERLREIMGKGR